MAIYTMSLDIYTEMYCLLFKAQHRKIQRGGKYTKVQMARTIFVLVQNYQNSSKGDLIPMCKLNI